MIRTLVTTFFLFILIAATVARVVALWPQPSGIDAPEQFVPVSDSVPETSGLDLSPGLELLERLEPWFDRSDDDYEALLLRGLLLFQAGKMDEAIAQLKSLTRMAPRFELAHLVLGDLLSARFTPLDAIGSAAPTEPDDSIRQQRLEGLRSEALARLQGYLSLLNGDRVPRSLIALGESTPYALMIDKSKNRLYVFSQQEDREAPRLVDDYYIVLGQKVGDKMIEGDLKTPTGTYFVTSYLAADLLPPLYGSGAFPINYPNEFDRRQQKTGFGIWLHGTDRTLFSRPPLDSEGCVVLTNEEFEQIQQYVVVGRTPVIISEKLQWISRKDWLAQKKAINLVIQQWRQHWESGDLQSYLAMYSKDFWAPRFDYDSWGDYKKQVFAGKTFQQIALSDVSLLGYPRDHDDTPLIVANFVQHYRSNNFNGDMHKRLYLIKEHDQWRVVYEAHQ
ncbi:MAG: L,D-transpeptidase family protein [Pelovirga sp.]